MLHKIIFRGCPINDSLSNGGVFGETMNPGGVFGETMNTLFYGCGLSTLAFE